MDGVLRLPLSQLHFSAAEGALAGARFNNEKPPGGVTTNWLYPWQLTTATLLQKLATW